MTTTDAGLPPPATSPGGRGPLSILAAGVLFAVVAVPSGLFLGGNAPNSSAPVPSTGSTTASEGESPDTGSDGEFEQFVAACADSFEGWRPGQASYPRTLDIDLDESRTYTARIDIRPGAQEQPAPDAQTGTADLQVRCGIGARLVAVGSSVSVDDGDWFLQQFGEPGTVQWDWTVTATAAPDAELRLELRPAVAAVDGSYTVPAEANANTTTTSFTTDVHVRTSAIQQVGGWFDDSWPIITAVAVALGGAILGFIAWVKKLRAAIAPPTAPGAPAPALPAVPPPAVSPPAVSPPAVRPPAVPPPRGRRARKRQAARRR